MCPFVGVRSCQKLQFRELGCFQSHLEENKRTLLLRNLMFCSFQTKAADGSSYDISSCQIVSGMLQFANFKLLDTAS